MNKYWMRSYPEISQRLLDYYQWKAKEQRYLSDISAMENCLATGRQIESTESLIRSIVFARHEHIGGASNRTSDSTYNAVNQLSHEIQAQDKATEDIQRALGLRKKQLEDIQREITLVETYLKQLTGAERQVIHAFYGKGYTLQQIADTLLINYRHYSKITIKRLKMEALKHLDMIIQDDISNPLKLP